MDQENPIRRENKRESRIYPLISLAGSILIFVGALLLAKQNGWIYLIAISLLLWAFLMWKKWLLMIPFVTVTGGIYVAISYAISRDIYIALPGLWRIAGLFLAIVPSFYLYPEDLIRCLNQMKFPRMASLALLITLRFFPLLRIEQRRIKEAMKSRGIPFSLKRVYRANIIPFVLRLVNLSDALSLSIETKGFQRSYEGVTSYRKVPFYWYDVVYTVLLVAIFVISLIFLPGVSL